MDTEVASMTDNVVIVISSLTYPLAMANSRSDLSCSDTFQPLPLPLFVSLPSFDATSIMERILNTLEHWESCWS
jgi:hypothetical protein